MEHEKLCHSGPERRSEPRINCSSPAELTIINNDVSSSAAVITDVSSAGLRVIANVRMSPGQQVQIKMGKLVILAEVRHCQAKSSAYICGVAISCVMGEQSVCSRLTAEQIELLVLGGGLSVVKRIHAMFHVLRCRPCAEQFRATRTFFNKLRSLKADNENSCLITAR